MRPLLALPLLAVAAAPPREAARSQLDSLRSVQRRSRAHIDVIGRPDDPHTASPLPLYERLQREHGVHARQHPQALRRGRRAQAAGDGALTEANTDPLRIEVDFSAMYETTPETPPIVGGDYAHVPGQAKPYSVCFRVGDWFMWNFPTTREPPCSTAGGWDESTDHAAWIAGDQNGCAGVAGVAADVFSPTNPEGTMCNRRYDSNGQNCWGVCVKEDVLQTEDEEGCTATSHINRQGQVTSHTIGQGGWSAATCNARAWAMEVITQDTREIEAYYRVRKIPNGNGNLVLSHDEGVFAQIYEQRGVGGPACAKDAQEMYRLPVSDDYCTTGADGHTIFLPIMGQYIPNVAGWGGDAGKDENGRPIILVMGITVPQTAWQRAAYDHRAIVLHELVHGLGFGIWNFQNTFLADGSRKEIVAQELVDEPGARRGNGVPNDKDQIWSVVSERTIAAARTYFNCSTLTHLPLMGENALGETSRGSHWETRIMNDEFMAYGEGSSVSAITLAVMEDMGNYMANYSAAQCMTWGKNQGCEFVASRCTSTRTMDLSITKDAAADPRAYERPYIKSYGGQERNGNALWTYPAIDIVSRKCTSHPNCGDSTHGQEFDAPGPVTMYIGSDADRITTNRDWSSFGDKVNAECIDTRFVTGELMQQLGCGARPPGDIMAAGRSGARSGGARLMALLEGRAMTWLVVGCFIVFAFIVFSCTCLNKENYKYLVMLAVGINGVTIILGVAFLITGLYAYNARNAAVADADETSVFVVMAGERAILVLIALGAVMVLWAIYGAVAICYATKDRNKPMGIFVFILLLVIITQTIGASIMLVWIKDTYSIEAKTYNALSGGEESSEVTRTGVGFIDALLDESMMEIEAYTCNTYRKCCWIQTSAVESFDNRTCTTGHSGVTVGGAAQELSDPSSHRFCELISGKSSEKTPVFAVCKGLEKAGVFVDKDGVQAAEPLAQCREDFCTDGKEGFERFVTNTFSWLRENFEW